MMTTALLDPQIDRSRGLDDPDLADRVLRVVKETREGIVVRGAKMIATAAPYCHDFLIFPFHRVREEQHYHAHALIVPANLPGLHIVCRDSFAKEQADHYPLSARYDEMDAVLFFDDVLVPWERVLLYGDPEAVWKFRTNRTANALAFHQTVVRQLAKMEFVAGVAFAVAEAIGVHRFLHVQEKLGELITQVETVKALLVASEAGAERDGTGTMLPALAPIETARILGTKLYPRALEILQQIGAGGFIQVPSTLEDLRGPIAGLAQRYFAGASVGTDEKVRLFKLAWDVFGSELGSRHELYERYYAGDPVRAAAALYLETDKRPYVQPVWELLGVRDKSDKGPDSPV